MNLLKLIYQTMVQLGRQAGQMPQAIANAVRLRQQKIILHELEAERIDRIRNPSKYRGK